MPYHLGRAKIGTRAGTSKIHERKWKRSRKGEEIREVGGLCYTIYPWFFKNQHLRHIRLPSHMQKEAMRCAWSVPQVHAAETKALAAGTCITVHQLEEYQAFSRCHCRSTEHQSQQNSAYVSTEGRGELSGKEMNLNSPWKNLLGWYLFMSESLDRTDPHKNRHV